MRARVWSLALACWLSLGHTQVLAEPELASLDAARRDFAAGVSAAQRHDWPAALTAFLAAYRVAPEPAVLFNLAGAQLRCGKLLASNTNYRRLLAGPTPLDLAERKLVEQQVALIERRMPRLRLHIDGLRENDRLLLDHARVYADELDRDMWLDPGTHELSVVRASGSPQIRTLTLSEGEVRVLVFSLL